MVRYIGTCLGLTRGYRPRLVLALAVPRVFASRGLSQLCMYKPLTEIQCMGYKER
jgi:hypothetical protein